MKMLWLNGGGEYGTKNSNFSCTIFLQESAFWLSTMPNSTQTSPQQQQQVQQQAQQQQQQQQQAQQQSALQQIIATSAGVPITFDGQEATFIPAGTQANLVSAWLWNGWVRTTPHCAADYDL